CYLDGKLVHDETAASPDKFLALAGRDESSGDIVLKAINTSAEPMTATLNIAGTEQLAPEAEVTVIKSDQLSDNNSLEDPAKVAPVTGKAAISGPKFTHEFPGYYFALMRLNTT